MKTKKTKEGIVVTFEDRELWNLDMILSSIIRQGIEQFRKMDPTSYPGFMENREEWDNALDEMIEAFKLCETGDDMENKSAKGLKIFAEYFRCLWN